MTNDLDQLETEVNAGIAALSGLLDVELPPPSKEEARLAARVSLNEQWLGSHKATEVSPAVRLRVLAAVRRELGETTARTNKLMRWKRNVPGLSALASAAMIGICVGLIRYTAAPSHLNLAQSSDQSFEQFVQAGHELYEVDPVASDIDYDLQNLEESIAQWPTETDRLEDGLQQIDEMIDGLQIDADESDTL